MDRGRMLSALGAGVAAAVIWVIISAITDHSAGAIVLWAVILLVGVTAITYLISTMIVASKRRSSV